MRPNFDPLRLSQTLDVGRYIQMETVDGGSGCFGQPDILLTDHPDTGADNPGGNFVTTKRTDAVSYGPPMTP